MNKIKFIVGSCHYIKPRAYFCYFVLASVEGGKLVDALDDEVATRVRQALMPFVDDPISDSLPERPRKARVPLTEEEKEERRRKKQELEKQRREEAAQKREEQRKQLWESNNYVSTNLPLSEDRADNYEKDGKRVPKSSIYDVQGDVTKPERAPNDISAHALILQPVDDGGHFGTGGLFSALRELSTRIPESYEMSSQMDDLHRGDSHLIEDIIEEQESEALEELNPDENLIEANRIIRRRLSVVLMVVQSVRDRYTKTINPATLRKCLERIQNYAIQNGVTSVHLPQIWFGVQGIDSAKVRTLLDQYLCSHAVNVYIYRYRRQGGRRHHSPTFRQKQLGQQNKTANRRTPSPSSSSAIDPPPRKRSRYMEKKNEDDELMEDEEQDISEREDKDEYLPSESEEESVDYEDEMDNSDLDFEAEDEELESPSEEDFEDDVKNKRKRKTFKTKAPRKKRAAAVPKLGANGGNKSPITNGDDVKMAAKKDVLRKSPLFNA